MGKTMPPGCSTSWTKKTADMAVRTEARDAAYGDDYYIEQGDTAMIHLTNLLLIMKDGKHSTQVRASVR